MGHVYGVKYLIYNYGFPPCYLMKKSQQFKFQKANTPQEKVMSFPCLAFADIGGSDVDVGMGNHQAECFHLSILPDELSHVFLSARIGSPEDWDFCTSAADFIRISNHEKSATCNHNHNYRGHDPDLLKPFKKPMILGRKFVGFIRPKNYWIRWGPISIFIYYINKIYNRPMNSTGFWGISITTPPISWVFWNASNDVFKWIPFETCYNETDDLSQEVQKLRSLHLTSICHLRVPVLG